MARLRVKRYGTRTEVMNGSARMTQGRLTKDDFVYNEYGYIVSKKKSKLMKGKESFVDDTMKKSIISKLTKNLKTAAFKGRFTAESITTEIKNLIKQEIEKGGDALNVAALEWVDDNCDCSKK